VKLVTHVLATTAGVQALHLQGREAFLAFAFGVAIDVDHAIKAPFYLKAIGWKNKLGFYWRSSLQEPVAPLERAAQAARMGSLRVRAARAEA